MAYELLHRVYSWLVLLLCWCTGIQHMRQGLWFVDSDEPSRFEAAGCQQGVGYAGVAYTVMLVLPMLLLLSMLCCCVAIRSLGPVSRKATALNCQHCGMLVLRQLDPPVGLPASS